MSLRKILLIIMLAALGASALTGILAVFAASGDVLGKLMGSAITTAITAGVLLPMSLLTDRPKLRAGGFTGMATLLVCWLCVMLLIWGDFLSHGMEWRIGSTLGFTLLIGLPASVVLLLTSFKWMRIAAYAFVALSAGAWLLCLAGSWVAASWSIFGSDRLAENLWGTGLVSLGIGAICCVLLVNLGMGDRRYFRWAGVVLGLLAIAIAVGGIWSSTDDALAEAIFRVALTVCSVLAHFNLLLMARLKPSQDWLKWATMACSTFAGLAVIAPVVLGAFLEPSELFDRAAAAATITAGCGSIALIVLSALNRRVDRPAVESFEMKNIELTCPRCKSHQNLPLGDASCAGCGLQIFTRVVEPRCAACGYNLFNITSNRCPECGALVNNRNPEVPPALPVSPAPAPPGT